MGIFPLPDKVSLELISPSGATTGRYPIKSNVWQEKDFPLEASLVRVQYDLLDERSAEESIAVFILNPLPGIWNLVVYGELIINGEFDIYLPTNDFIERNTIFLKPDPYTTIVLPSTNTGTITVGASALLLEWGIVKGNDPSINTIATKAYLSRGARRRDNVSYPNREWGYGELDLLNTFQELQ